MFSEILAGALLKIYDDFVDDDPILQNEYAIAILRTLQIAVTTLVVVNDFWICLVVTLFNLMCAIGSFTEYTGPHVVSYAVLSPLFLVLSWNKRSAIGPFDWAVISMFLGTALAEPILFPEEMSWFKTVTRAWAAAVSFSSIVFFPQMNPSIAGAVALSGGYSIASSMGQMLKLTGLVRTQHSAPSAYGPLHAYIPTLE